MIASLIAAFGAGVFATLISLFSWEEISGALKGATRVRRPWKTATSAEGSTEITCSTRPGPFGRLCGEALRVASIDKSLTHGPANEQMVDANRYRIFVSWKMVFTVDPDAEKEP